MIKNQEEDEFVAVRVQDPRVQNEGSWNSYVDFKIFLHTNSKAFTAKTSCVRRRYSEFVWLKKRMQKNTGLVPVPDLPGKSFFAFSNEDFLEKRRKGLQSFLDKVCSMTVCLSDSQLHLFLQTQLPVGHILDCVQGHTPYTVTEAILTYASSNRGWVQEEDSTQEPSLSPVPYESMESPAPHLPSLQRKEPVDPASVASSESLVVRTETYLDTVELLLCERETPSQGVTRKNHHVFQVEAVLELHSPVEDVCKRDSHDETTPERLECEEIHHQGDCQRRTSVELHCENDSEEVQTERVSSLMTETVPPDRSSQDSGEEVVRQGNRQQHPLGAVHFEGATGLELLSAMAPGDGTCTDPPTGIVPEEAPEDGHRVRGTIPEDVRPAEEPQKIIGHEETMSKVGGNSDTDIAIWTHNQGRGDEIKSHIEVCLEDGCREVTIQEGEGIGDRTQEKNIPLNIHQVDDRLDPAQGIKNNKEINGAEEEHPSDWETASSGSTHDESDNDSVNENKSIQKTNGYTETAPNQEIHQTDFPVTVCSNTDFF
ncbi:sorting nexin-11 [Esox lucius]|nr:sorting nexin-11 [Esox lucius]